MSTIGHLAVGAALGRVTAPGADRRARLWMGWLAFIAIAPDLDFIGVWFFGVGPGSTWNHRGATHSMAAALVGGLLTVAVAPRLGIDRRLGFGSGLLAVATHPILDGFCLHSAGSPLWWPLSLDFWQARARFLPGVVETRDYFTGPGLLMLWLELLWFAPFLWIALRRRRAPGVPAHPPAGQKNTGGE